VPLLIVVDCPSIFEQFRVKRFNLAWRDNRDGFGVVEFHCGCDGRMSAMTLISEADRNVLSIFTLLECESHNRW
jgi:hypothetical protein